MVALSRAGLRLAAAVAVGVSVSAAALGSESIAASADPFGTTTLVSVSSDGVQGNDESMLPAVSANGRYVAFSSFASNLVPGDTNGWIDVFVRDRATGTTRRVSVSSGERQGNYVSGATGAAISANGRYVAFASGASNLVPGDTNGVPDVFVRDRATGTTRRVSLTSNGKQGHLACMPPGISADGRFVSFATRSRLVRGDTNNAKDVYVRDRKRGTTRRVSIGNRGAQGNQDSGSPWVGSPSLTAHGGTVAFGSYATNLVHGDHNGVLDVFVRTSAGVTQRVSISSAETGADADSRKPVISAHGRYVAFQSEATNLGAGADHLEVYVRDRIDGTTELVSVRSDGSMLDGLNPAMSADARYVAFQTPVPTMDVYVRDRLTGTTSLVSTDDSGTPGNNMSIYPVISAEGHQVAFTSDATDLVPGDANGVRDVFIRHTSDSGQR